MKVELIYDADCPNVAATRARLIAAFAAAGLAPRWQEWQRGSEGSPEYARRFGSPTILVDGRDQPAHVGLRRIIEHTCAAFLERDG